MLKFEKKKDKKKKVENKYRSHTNMFIYFLPSLICGIIIAVICINDVNTTVSKHKMIEILDDQIRILTAKATLTNSSLTTYSKESNILLEISRRKLPLLEISSPPKTFKVK